MSISTRAPAGRLDPIAFPGVESVERRGAPVGRPGRAPTAGVATSPGTGDGPGDGPERPALLSGPVDLAVPHVAPSDRYSLRLVASRSLFDQGAAVRSVPALAGLVATAPLRVNPHDLDELGIAAGGSVRLRTATASALVSSVPDPSLPRKVVAADFNVPLDEGTIADLIEVSGPVVELRMESP